MWNDTDTPLAYLITFRCFATWLHGDKRGSIDRFHDRYKSPYIKPNEGWHLHNVRVLESEPVVLNPSQRQSVDHAVRETCDFRKWHLHALNVRTNHVHVVVSIGGLRPERALTAFKANATRQMREDGYWRRVRVLGQKKGAKDTSGTSVAWRKRLTMCSTDKEINHLTLTINPVATARGTDSTSSASIISWHRSTGASPNARLIGTQLIAAAGCRSTGINRLLRK